MYRGSAHRPGRGNRGGRRRRRGGGGPTPRRGADGHYRAALALAEELGMRPLVAHCHFGLGKLYRRTGTREQAQEHVATAPTMYRDMGMTYWLEQAEAAGPRVTAGTAS